MISYFHHHIHPLLILGCGNDKVIIKIFLDFLNVHRRRNLYVKPCFKNIKGCVSDTTRLIGTVCQQHRLPCARPSCHHQWALTVALYI